MKTKYRVVVFYDLSEFEHEVERLMSMDWVLVGGVSISSDADGVARYAQTLIKK